jgi:hypothetical protein
MELVILTKILSLCVLMFHGNVEFVFSDIMWCCVGICNLVKSLTERNIRFVSNEKCFQLIKATESLEKVNITCRSVH